MSFWNRRVRVLVRPKVGGGGDHYAVELEDGSILDLSAGGARLLNYHQFAQGLPVREVYVAPSNETASIMTRVREALARPQAYRFFVWNCEHFANWIVGKPVESSQVNGVFFAGFVLVLLRAFVK